MNMLRKYFAIAFAGLLCLWALPACGPATAAVSGTAPMEPQRASVAPVVVADTAQPAVRDPADAIHITWMYGIDPDQKLAEQQHQLDILRELLGKGGWNVTMDFLPLQYWGNVGAYATDALVIPNQWGAKKYATADDFLNEGVTMDTRQLCAQYAPVLAEKYAGMLTPAGIPISIEQDTTRSSICLLLLRDKVPQQWLSAPPAMSEIVSWVENSGAPLVHSMPGGGTDIPFLWALEAWAGEKGYYSLGRYQMFGGLYAKSGDAAMQPVPIEDIEGFDDIYRRLFALYQAGKYCESASRPADSVGYLRGYLDEVQQDFLQANHVSAEDVVAIPVRDTAWEIPAPRTARDVLAIPKGSRHVEQVLKLAQWVLTTREGYDLVNYGVLNEDYTLQNERWQRVKGSEMEKLVDYRFGKDYTMERVRANQPGNAGEVAGTLSYVKLPVLDVSKVETYDKNQYVDALDSVMNPIRMANYDLIEQRTALLLGVRTGEEGGDDDTIPNADWGLRQLRELDRYGAVRELVKSYQTEIAKLVSKQ